MILRLLMAAVRKGPSGALERVPSAGTRNKPIGAPLRAIHPNSSPVYKTQSETALTAGLEKLTINNNKNNLLPKRSLSGRTSTNGLVRNLSDAARLLQSETVKNVVVVAGAGISTPSGIPDFRSPGTGLYDNLQQYSIPYPEAIFDIDYFFVNPRPFFTLAKELYPSGKYRPNYIHYFVRQLYDKGLLLRMYTQNIDGLERLAGVPEEKLVEAHGTFATATCTTCRHKMDGSEIKDKIFSDKLPRCPTRGCVGIVKPDIVFFGEDLPRKFYSYMKDMLQADLVLVMGTSLEVQPFAGIIDTVRYNVPRVLFNREAVGPFRFNRRTQDVVATGDLVDSMVKFATQIGWKEDMVQLITKQEGQFVILNKAPVTQTSQNKFNSYNRGFARQRPTFDLYDSDSSSVESTESDSDATSSDSSEEENRKGRFRGVNRGKLFNNNVRNGAIKNNVVRSTSAKLNNGNSKRQLHTQRNITSGKNSPADSLTGRSVKSESAINNTLAKRRLENGKNVTPISDNKAKADVELVSPQPRSEVSSVNEKQKTQRAEREKVLKKYGLGSQPTLNNLNKVLKPPNNTVSDGNFTYNGSKPPVEKIASTSNVLKSTLEKRDRSVKPVKSDSAIDCSAYFLEDLKLNKEVKTSAFEEVDETVAVNPVPVKRIDAFENKEKSVESEQNNKKSEFTKQTGKKKAVIEEKDKVAEMDAFISNEIESFRQQRNVKHIESLEVGVNRKSEGQNSWTQETLSERKGLSLLENKNTDVHVNSDICLGVSDISLGVSQGIKENSSQDKMAQLPNDANEDAKTFENAKMIEHNAWKKETSSRDKVLQLLDQRAKGAVEIDSCINSVIKRNQNPNEKGSKVLTEKAAKSFHKYAKVASHKKEGGKKHGKKKRRVGKKDRPSAGVKPPTGKTQLKTVNSRPYGYAHRQANVVKGVGPFNRTNIRTLNSAMERTHTDLLVRSGSADLPKISYRHQIHPTSTCDTRIFGTTSTLLISPDGDGSFSDDSR